MKYDSPLMTLPYFWAKLLDENFCRLSENPNRLPETHRTPLQEERFARINLTKLDNNLKNYFHFWGTNEWLGVRLEMIGTVVLSAGAFFLVVLPSTQVDAGKHCSRRFVLRNKGQDKQICCILV